MLIIDFMLTELIRASGERRNKRVDDVKYIGTWKCESMTIGSEKSAPENEIILTLNGDGTAVLASGDDVTNANWEELSDGFKLTGDAKMTFKNEEGGVKSTVLGVTMHFVRQ